MIIVADVDDMNSYALFVGIFLHIVPSAVVIANDDFSFGEVSSSTN